MNNNSQLTLDNLNQFIDNANKTLSCDTNCQKANKNNNLKNIYLDSITNSASSSAQEQIAYKNYIIATQGQSAYDNEIDKQLNQKANMISDIVIKIFNENLYNTELSLGTYKGLLINFNNLVDYYVLNVNKNARFENNSKIKTSDVLTNERKTFYEDQSIERIKYINKLLFYFYFLLIILLIIFAFIFPLKLSYLKIFVIVILLVIYPFIALKLFSFLIYIYNFIVLNILPKNVYKTI